MSGLVRVWTDIGQKKPKPLLARIVNTKAKLYTIQYLSPTEDRIKGRTIYRYEDETYEIDDDSIYEYLSLSNELDMGFVEVEGGYIKDESDEEYVPTDSENEDSDSDDEEDTEEDDDEENEEEFEDDEEDEYSDGENY
jgi:TATA-binding protein-associated factor Taf7